MIDLSLVNKLKSKVEVRIMSKKCIAVFLFSIVFVFGSQIFAQLPKLPYMDVGACPFECCTYRQWTANEDTALLKTMNDNSPVAFRIKKGEKVTGVTGVVITTKAGIVKALRNTTIDEIEKVPFNAGEILYLLTYRGEGYYRTWYKGRYLFDSYYNNPDVKQISDPELVWWVKIKNRKGQIGWTKLPENFDNKDACGDSSEIESEEVKPSETQAFTKITSDAGIYFRQGLVNLQNNRRSQAREYFDRSVEVFLLSGINIQTEQKLSNCYNQLIETVYRIEFPADKQLPNIRTLSAKCGWNIENKLADNIAKLIETELNSKKPVNNTANQSSDSTIGFTEQKFEPSPLDEISKLELIQDEAVVTPTPTPTTKPKTNRIKIVKAQKGDTVTTLAKRNGANPVDVAKFNGLLPTSKLPAGREIKIPDVAANLPQAAQQYQYYVIPVPNKSLGFSFQVHPMIQQSLTYYQGKGRSTMETGLYRSGMFMRMARRIFREEGIPENVAWLGLFVSNWKPESALGLWRINEETAKKYELKITILVDERNSFEKATRASAQYLKFLANRYGGNWELAMAAYNSGEGNVDRAIARAGVANFWAAYPYLPTETRDYVPNILATILIANNPAQYGFGQVRPAPQLMYDQIRVPASTDLSLVAQASDTSVEYLRYINPELRTNVTPPEPYIIRVPAGKANEVVALFKKLPVTNSKTESVTNSTKGETWESISARTGVSVQDLRAANGGAAIPGEKVVIPKGNAGNNKIMTPVKENLPQESDNDDLFPITIKEKSGFINSTGNIVIPPKYFTVSDFCEGLAAVGIKITIREGYYPRYGYIDKKGNLLITPKYKHAGCFSEGLASAADEGSGRSGFINKKGEFVFFHNYESADKFSDGLALVQRGEKYGYINSKGKLVIPLMFDQAFSFSNGVAQVGIGVFPTQKYGFIDTNGNYLIKPRFENIVGEFSEGLGSLSVGTYPNSRYGFIDLNGNFVIRPQFEYAGDFSEGLAHVVINKKYGFIDKTGKVVIETRFDGASSFKEGLASVLIGNTWGFINKAGELVIPATFEGVESFKNGLARVAGLDDSYYIDKKGATVWKPGITANNYSGLTDDELNLMAAEMVKEDIIPDQCLLESGHPKRIFESASKLQLSPKGAQGFQVYGKGCACLGARRCGVWLFLKTADGFRLIADGGPRDGFQILKTITNGYYDVRASIPDSFLRGIYFSDFKFNGSKYEESKSGCIPIKPAKGEKLPPQCSDY
jgi:LysM repeat protein